MMRSIVAAAFALLLPLRQQAPAAAPAQAAATSQDVAVQSWISQTAVWPGDALDYAVQLTLAPRVQLAGDLSGATMSWAPFRLLGFARTDETLPDGASRVTLRYRLVAVDLAEGGRARVPPLRVAYIAPQDRPAASGEIPAQELELAGPAVAFRSTLERPVEEATIRDGKELAEGRYRGRTLLLIGLAGLLVGAYPFARSARQALRRARERRHVADPRAQRRQLQEAVAALRAAPLGSAEEYERLYGDLFGALRDHLSLSYGLDYPGLTSADVEDLRRGGVPEALVQRIGEFLEECEMVRYEGVARSDDAERRARAAVGLVEGVLTA